MSDNAKEAVQFYWECIEDAFDDINIYADAPAFAAGLDEFPEWVGDLVCVHSLLAELLNGGLTQFFYNSTGVLAPEAAAGLERMGLPEAAGVLRRAVEVFGSPYPRDKGDRYQIMRTKAGLQFEDMEIMMWRARLFKTMEDQLDEIGGQAMREVYAKMNEYARNHADEGST